MMSKDPSLVHIQHVREILDRVEKKLDSHIERTDKAFERGEQTTREVKGLAEGAHARISAFENKGKGVLFGISLGGGSLGAALVKWWPFS